MKYVWMIFAGLLLCSPDQALAQRKWTLMPNSPEALDMTVSRSDNSQIIACGPKGIFVYKKGGKAADNGIHVNGFSVGIKFDPGALVPSVFTSSWVQIQSEYRCLKIFPLVGGSPDRKFIAFLPLKDNSDSGTRYTPYVFGELTSGTFAPVQIEPPQYPKGHDLKDFVVTRNDQIFEAVASFAGAVYSYANGEWTKLLGPSATMSSSLATPAIAVDPNDSRIVYKADEKGFYIWNDGDWDLLSDDLKDLVVQKILFGYSPNVIFVLGRSNKPIGYDISYSEVVPGVRGGIYKSIDGGITWKESNQGLPDKASGHDLLYPVELVMDIGNPKRLMAAFRDMSAVYESLDEGNTWKQFAVGSGGEVHSLHWDFSNQRLLVGTQQGIGEVSTFSIDRIQNPAIFRKLSEN